MSVNPGVIIDVSNASVFPFGVNPWQGPVTYLNNLWVPAVNGIGAAVQLFWYKSTDHGATWIEKDTANAPAILKPISYAYPWGGGAKWYYSQATNAPSAGKIPVDFNIYEFSMSLEAWNTTPITTMSEAVQNLTVSGNPTLLLCLRHTQPNFVFFYGPDTPNQLSAQVYNGSSWSSVVRAASVTPLPPNSNPYTLRTGTVDASNICHLIFSRAIDKISYVQFDPSGPSFGVASDIFTTNANGAANAKAMAVFKADTDEIIFPVRQSDSTPFNGFHVLRGTPTSSPVWTTESVNLQTFFPRATYSIRNAYSTLLSVPDEDYSTLFIAFSTVNDDTNLEQKLWYISNSGSGWSDPVLVWDISNNPPANFPGDWSTPQSDGLFGGTIGPNGELWFTEYGLYTLTTPPSIICGIITFVSIEEIVRQHFWRVREA